MPRRPIVQIIKMAMAMAAEAEEATDVRILLRIQL